MRRTVAGGGVRPYPGAVFAPAGGGVRPYPGAVFAPAGGGVRPAGVGRPAAGVPLPRRWGVGRRRATIRRAEPRRSLVLRRVLGELRRGKLAPQRPHALRIVDGVVRVAQAVPLVGVE